MVPPDVHAHALSTSLQPNPPRRIRLRPSTRWNNIHHHRRSKLARLDGSSSNRISSFRIHSNWRTWKGRSYYRSDKKCYWRRKESFPEQWRQICGLFPSYRYRVAVDSKGCWKRAYIGVDFFLVEDHVTWMFYGDMHMYLSEGTMYNDNIPPTPSRIASTP